MSEELQPEVERGAIIPPTDAYCSPEFVDTDSNSEWVVLDAEELEANGIKRCGVCEEKGYFQ